MEKKFLFLVIIVILVLLIGGVLLWLTGCIKGKVAPNMPPDKLMAQFVPFVPPWGENISRDHVFWWASEFGFDSVPEGFIEGFSMSWRGMEWVKKDGKSVPPPNDPFGFILNIAVLKYESAMSAKEDYERIIAKQEFKDFSLEGIKLVSKSGVPPGMKIWLEKYADKLTVKEEQCYQYLLRSNNFIIYTYGLNEAAEDVMLRIIDKYKVE
ncbi:hypothetical protein FJZ33_01525 [Candidatus Poribacteria bacterium]|nr:hypothetical protein [Candidatus Poribacteria bacterium]